MFGKNKNKIKVIFVKPLGEKDYEKIGETDINKEDDVVSYKDKTFPLTSSCYFYINKGKPHIFIDYETEKIISLKQKDIGINANFLDKLLSTSKGGIIGQLLYALKLDMQQKTNWSTMMKPMTIFILGAIIGYLLGSPNPFGV